MDAVRAFLTPPPFPLPCKQISRRSPQLAEMPHGGPVARVKLSIEAQKLASMDWTSKSVRRSEARIPSLIRYTLP